MNTAAHHILTVGISLLTNYSKTNNVSLKSDELLRLHRDIRKFLFEEPTKACAEINSLNARTHFLSGRQARFGVTLIYTETKESKSVASLLESYLKNKGVTPCFKIPIKGLDKPAKDATPEWAQQNVTEALSRLRSGVIEHIAKLRRQKPDIAIELNCTGGYKAEVAVLYEVGRTLRLPVYYLHETFKTCVTLP